VYHCVDEYTEFTGADRAGLLALEQQLMEKSRGRILIVNEAVPRTGNTLPVHDPAASGPFWPNPFSSNISY
jgi:hypothetical protein